MSISDYLVEARLKLGLSRAKLARLVGVSGAYMHRIENSENVPSAALCERLALHLGLNKEHVMLKAGHVPPDLLAALREHPEFCNVLRRELAGLIPAVR